MQAERHRDREVVDEGAQRRAFLVHVDEDLAEPAVVIFAGAQIDLVAADHRLLGVALAAVGHALALAHHDDALDDLLDHLLGERGGARRGGRSRKVSTASSSSSSSAMSCELSGCESFEPSR